MIFEDIIEGDTLTLMFDVRVVSKGLNQIEVQATDKDSKDFIVLYKDDIKFIFCHNGIIQSNDNTTDLADL